MTKITRDDLRISAVLPLLCCTVSVTADSVLHSVSNSWQSLQENEERHFKKQAVFSGTSFGDTVWLQLRTGSHEIKISKSKLSVLRGSVLRGARFDYSCVQEVTRSKSTRWETADVVWRPYVKYTIFRTKNTRETPLCFRAATNIGRENTLTCHTNRTGKKPLEHNKSETRNLLWPSPFYNNL